MCLIFCPRPEEAVIKRDLSNLTLAATPSLAERTAGYLPSRATTFSREAEYRPEIDGLRAIAVLGVVLFHQTLATFSGGFVGVDVFFVISGYLITHNIVADVRRGNFSFVTFLIKRARRILPALLFTIAVAFTVGTLLLAPETLRELSKESTHAMLSISNIQFWRESSSYFAQASDQLPLLHFWSLSLEVQFYLLWPFVILLGFKLDNVLFTIVALAGLSFCAALICNVHHPEAVFFLMPFRIFEFAIGGAVVFAESARKSAATSEILSSLGLLTVVISMVSLTAASPFWVATLFPCLGTAAVILCGRRPLAARLIATGPALAVGRASYSLYLCHWPIIFFARIIFGDAAAETSGMIAADAFMFAFAFIMHRYVEKPFRHGAKTPARTSIAFASIIVILVCLTHSTFLSGGWTWRISAEQIAQTQLQGAVEFPCNHFDGLRCSFGDLNAPLGVEIIGDSFARHYVYALEDILKNKRVRGEIGFALGCPLIEGVTYLGRDAEYCKRARDTELSRLKQNSNPVIVAENWERYSNSSVVLEGRTGINGGRFSLIQEGLERLIENAGATRQFLLIGAQVVMPQCNLDRARSLPAPLRYSKPLHCAAKSRDQARQEGSEINAMLREIQHKRPDQVSLLIPVETFCDAECPVWLNGLPLYQDASHFTVAGATYFGERAKPSLTRFLFDGFAAP
jgi:peptidoglycan/LPS O-acetylase OafA/YrhL